MRHRRLAFKPEPADLSSHLGLPIPKSPAHLGVSSWLTQLQLSLFAASRTRQPLWAFALTTSPSGIGVASSFVSVFRHPLLSEVVSDDPI